MNNREKDNTTIHTSEEIDDLIHDLETMLDDVRTVRIWMQAHKRKAIESKFWPSVKRGIDSLKTGIRGLLEARHRH